MTAYWLLIALCTGLTEVPILSDLSRVVLSKMHGHFCKHSKLLRHSSCKLHHHSRSEIQIANQGDKNNNL